MIDKINCDKKIANDNNQYLIELLRHRDKIKDLPNTVTKKHYSEVRDSYHAKDGKYQNWYIGAIGFLASYNGRFFDGGYSGTRIRRDGKTRNYYLEAKNTLLAQIPNLENIEFSNKDYKCYTEMTNENNKILYYCDPPYRNTKKYSTSKNFNSDEFWEWVRLMSKTNIVLVNEIQAPNDFKCIWSQEIKRNIKYDKSKKSVERLFIWKESGGYKA